VGFGRAVRSGKAMRGIVLLVVKFCCCACWIFLLYQLFCLHAYMYVYIYVCAYLQICMHNTYLLTCVYMIPCMRTFDPYNCV